MARPRSARDRLFSAGREELRSRGVQVVCAELGYLRPDWLVLERDGMTAHSRMPRDPAKIRELASPYPDPDFTVQYRTPFWRFTLLAMAYNLIRRRSTSEHPKFSQKSSLSTSG